MGHPPLPATGKTESFTRVCIKVKEFISDGHISTCAECLVLTLHHATPLCPVTHCGLVLARQMHTMELMGPT